MLRLSRGRGWLAAAALLLASGAQATTFNFNGNSGVVPTCPLTGTTYSCASLPNNSDTDVIIIASGYTVEVTSSATFSYNQGLQMSGTAVLLSKGNLNVADVNPANLKVTGGALKANGTFSAGAQAQTITADISAATINIGTGSTTKINGNLTATAGTITLASNVSVVGNVDAATVRIKAANSSVKGNINATTGLTIESNNTVNGNITGGTLTMDDGGVVINGNATMTGDVKIGSSGTINGDLEGRNVTTKASGDYISGNAKVNAIYLDYGARVGKVITCTGAAPGAPVCSCVTRADSNYQPTCGAAPVTGGAHHIQITHSGQGLTCQAQTVTLTACADATCGSIYNGSTTVTLTPGGGAAFSFNGSTSATVRYPTAASMLLSAAVSGISNANVCPNASTKNNDCNMVFSDNGLPISVPNHVAMNTVALNVQALKSDPSGTCVPLVKNATVDVNFSCQYNNPGSGAASVPLLINNGTSGTNVSCGNSGTSIKLKFDDNGLATPVPTLQYAEVGKVNITAAYVGSGGNVNLAASGSTSFISAPDRFVIEAIRVGGPYASGTMPTVPLAASAEPFTLKISAVNKDGVTTKNFGKEDSQESFTVDGKLKFPKNGVEALTKGSFDAIIDGVGSSSNDGKGPWVFAESGTVTLSAKLANQSTYYMNTNPSTAKFDTKGTQDVRFVPNHFETALVGGIPMSCAGVSSVANPCPSNETGKLVYSKQGFQLRVVAYNTAASTSISKNYRDLVDDDAVAVAKDITLTAWSTAGGTQAAAVANAATQAGVKFSFVEGTGNVGVVLPMFQFKTGLPDATDAAATPVTLFIRAEDTDKVTSKRSSNPVEAPLTIVGGRMQVTNTYGATSSPLPVEVQALYYSPTARAYVLNSQFSPVSPAVGANVSLDNNVVYSNCTGQLACGMLQVMAPKTLNFKNGKATFRLASPSAAGSVNVTVVPATTPAWTDTLPSTIPYLPMTTPGRATFGIYRSGPVIYTREVHN